MLGRLREWWVRWNLRGLARHTAGDNSYHFQYGMVHVSAVCTLLSTGVFHGSAYALTARMSWGGHECHRMTVADHEYERVVDAYRCVVDWVESDRQWLYAHGLRINGEELFNEYWWEYRVSKARTLRLYPSWSTSSSDSRDDRLDCMVEIHDDLGRERRERGFKVEMVSTYRVRGVGCVVDGLVRLPEAVLERGGESQLVETIDALPHWMREMMIIGRPL